MLFDKKLKAFLPTVKPDKAKRFYMKTLGLTLLSEDDFALEFDANGTSLRITRVQTLTPHPFTVLGWDVSELPPLVISLTGKGIKFERYNGLEQDKLGIWTSPSGAKVVWFKDPDGNLLSLTQHK